MSKRPQKPAASYGFVRLILVQPFIDELEGRGVQTSGILRGVGIDPSAVQDPARYVHAQTIYGIFNALADAADDPFLGYHVGSKLEFTQWPPFQRAVRNAKTVGQFMTEFIEAVPSEANSVRHELTIGSAGACYRVHRLIETSESPQHTEAFGIAHFVRLFQSVSGARWRPDEVLIRTQYTEAVPRRVQGVKVVKKSEGGLELHFPVAWLYAPVDLRSAFRRPRDGKLPDMADDISLIGVFQAAAKSMLHDLNAGLEDVAKAVGVESAKLKSALTHEGTSAAKEFKRLRLDTAKARLASNDGSISEIAGDLGYADPAHFTRFFRTQTGQSPRAYRLAHTKTG